MKADWVDEAQEVTQLMVDHQIDRIRSLWISTAVASNECECCGAEIPEARRRIVPGVKLCVECQSFAELMGRVGNGGNPQ